MDVNKNKTWIPKLIGLLPFTLILAIALIPIGIVFIAISKGQLQIKEVINYTGCKPIELNIKTCADYIQKPEKNRLCRCELNYNLSENLQGHLSIYTELEPIKYTNGDDKQSENIFENCTQNTDKELNTNATNEGIPDCIFKDTIVITKNIDKSTDDNLVVTLAKSKRWSPDVTTYYADNTDEVIKKRKIKVWMEPEWNTNSVNNTVETENYLPIGSYVISMNYYLHGPYNGERKLVFSVNRDMLIYSRFWIGIVSLVLGLLFLVVSIVQIILRRRVQGTDFNKDDAMLPSVERPPNNLRSEVPVEENPLTF